MGELDSRRVREWVHFLLTVLTALFVISGLGISDFLLMERVTFGLLTKSRSFWIHDNLLYPFTLLLFLHVYFTVMRRRPRKRI